MHNKLHHRVDATRAGQSCPSPLPSPQEQASVLAVGCSGKKIGESLDAGLKSVGLTSREVQILRHLALGKGDKEISIDLLISVKTVNHHVSNIILKLDAKNRTHAVAKALLARLIQMRASDAPIRIFNRRLGDQNKMVQAAVANNIPVSVGCQKPGHVEEALPWHIHEDSVESKSAA